MGTNMPEIAYCLEFLAHFDRESNSTTIYLPQGLEERFTPSEEINLVQYDPENNAWDCLENPAGRTFLLIDPRTSPVPQLEALASRLKFLEREPDKITTIVDCLAAEQSIQMRVFLEAAIYYSDIALLGNRSNISKPFLRSYQKEFERNCFPCLFLTLKGKGLPSDPLELLTPGVRRISQLFDLSDNQELADFDSIIEASCDLDFEELESDPYRPSEETPAAEATIPDVSQWIVQ